MVKSKKYVVVLTLETDSGTKEFRGVPQSFADCHDEVVEYQLTGQNARTAEATESDMAPVRAKSARIKNQRLEKKKAPTLFSK
jgi:hypothetical protein